MTVDHYGEWLTIEMSRLQRQATDLPEDTGERYDENGEIILLTPDSE